MRENQVSLTAIMTAYIRAYHAMYGSPLIFNDFLAHQMIPKERRTLIEQGFAKALQFNDPADALSCSGQSAALMPLMQTMGLPNVLSRARYTEENLQTAVSQGVQQYVILGAGLDTFAFRRPDLLEQLHVFEVDHPATQAFKRSRLTELGWVLPTNLHFIQLDFTKESLVASLKRSPYDPKTLSFFSWLGVTMYLNRDEVFATLSSISDIAPAGSMVIFDYFVPQKAATHIKEIWQDLRQIGEPVKTGFDPSTLAADLAGSGLRLYKDLSPSDIQERYFQGRKDGYYASEHVHFALAVVE